MNSSSRMADLIRRLGQASAPPIALRKLMLSADQSFFAFVTAPQDRGLVTAFYQQLGEAEVNIRLISQYRTEDGGLRVRLCLDACCSEAAARVIQTMRLRERMSSFERVEPARILSLYPFNGRPEVLERAFSELWRGGIEILATSSATSVVSCVLTAGQVSAALQVLNRVVMLE